MKYGFLLLSALVLFACKSKKDQVQEEGTQNRIFSIETTPCFGRCPIYTMSIGSDGQADLNAVRFTEADGQYLAHLEDSVVNELFNRLDAMNWLAYKAEYMTGYSDLPSVILTYTSPNGQIFKVRFEEGAAPQELEQLSRSMEWWRLNVDWKALEH